MYRWYLQLQVFCQIPFFGVARCQIYMDCLQRLLVNGNCLYIKKSVESLSLLVPSYSWTEHNRNVCGFSLWNDNPASTTINHAPQKKYAALFVSVAKKNVSVFGVPASLWKRSLTTKVAYKCMPRMYADTKDLFLKMVAYSWKGFNMWQGFKFDHDAANKSLSLVACCKKT